jgi:alkylated DNA repair dioxygenase AlkB
VQRQLDLFAAPALGFDASFSQLARRELAFDAWVDYQSRFVDGHDALFEQLEHQLRWRTEQRRMYDRMVVTPRLLASITKDTCLDHGHPAIALVEQMRLALSERYSDEFVRVTAALYRDGTDSVALHGDTHARDLDRALVATVSLGQPRRFVLRPAAIDDESTDNVDTVAYSLGHGDLIVMGGTCQRTWRHGIPKVAHAAGPRIAVMFRPAWSEDY